MFGFLSADSFYSDSYAVIIGINDYEKVNRLNYAVADAEAIKSLLVSKFNFPESNISLITDKEATLKNIKNSLFEVSTSTKKNDRLLVFFAGHGETFELSEGGEIGYLVPVDGDYDNLYTSSISMNEIKQISSIANAKHVLFLVDACYGGLMAVDSRGLDRKTKGYMKKITKDKARQIITAGGKGERVVEKAEWGHSAFTKNILTGLEEGLADIDNDGYITTNELGTFLKKRVTIDSQNHQTPQERRLTSDEGEFVFLVNSVNIKERKNKLINKVDENKVESLSVENIVERKVNENLANLTQKQIRTLLLNPRHLLGLSVLGIHYGYFINEGFTEIQFSYKFFHDYYLFLDKMGSKKSVQLVYKKYNKPYIGFWGGIGFAINENNYSSDLTHEFKQSNSGLRILVEMGYRIGKSISISPTLGFGYSYSKLNNENGERIGWPFNGWDMHIGLGFAGRW